MKRKFLACLLTVCLVITLLTGCGSKMTAGTENNSQEVNKEEGTSQDGEGITLKIWCSEETMGLVDAMCQAFSKKYQGTAKFNFVYEPMQEGEAIKSMLKDIDNAPDVFTFTDSPSALVAAGAVSPVPNTDEISKANDAGAVETATINDVLYAYPMTADNGYYLYYNKAVLSEADVATMDGILEKAAESGTKMTMDMSSGWYMYSFFGQTDLKVTLSDNGLSNVCNWNDTTTSIKGVDVANAIMNITANTAFLNTDDKGLVEGAKNGTVSAGISGVWLATALEEAWGDNLAATKLPTYTYTGGQMQMGSFAGYKMVGVNAYSQNQEWAHKLAEWLTNEENQMKRFEVHGLGPSNNIAAASEKVQASVPLQGLMAQAPYADLQRLGSNYWNPVSEFGLMMASRDLGGKGLQTILDEMVNKITASNGL